MPTLTITRGLPGSGKTTLAKAWVAEDPTHRARVNRDDFRSMLHGGYVDQERQINAARDAAITALLKRGIDVVADDTCLPQRHARDLRRLAMLAGADFDVWDLTNVFVDTCITRDAGRPAMVGEKVIKDMYQRYLAGKPYPLPWPDDADEATGVVPYVPVPGTPPAILVDIDGTVALMVARSPYDATRVHEDRPNLPVIAAVEAMHAAGYAVVFCSGRTEDARLATATWLRQHLPSVGVHAVLHMRPSGDMRKDAVVKAEIFDKEIRHNYDVRFVLDDRQQVVDMWREVGLTVFQVAPGNF